MSFQFVENGNVDKATRKLIRSHVMKGKNAGKTHQRKPRGGIKVVSISSRSVYPEELCLPVEATQALWFRYLLSDEACFHSILVMSEACINSLQGGKEMSSRGLHHLSSTYRCINMNLRRHGAPSDATVAAVMSLAIHEDLNGQHQSSRVHLEALVGMVQLRGGITQFEATRILLQKICRADIEYALQNGSRPRLNRDNFPHDLLQHKMASLSMPQNQAFFSGGSQVYDFTLQQVFLDLLGVSALLNHNIACFRLEPFAYQEILLSVCYRLLHRYPLATKGFGYGNETEELCYLGLLAFMSTLIFHHGFRRLSYPLLTDRLFTSMKLWLNRSLKNDSMTLWLLFIGGISVFDDTDNRTWLVSHIKQYLLRLQINTWSAVREEISHFPWIDIVHEGPGHKLWQAVSLQ